jgi:hypothetical protein
LELFTVPCHLVRLLSFYLSSFLIFSSNFWEPEQKLEFVARRPPIVKFAAVLSVIVNWTSTFFIFILTCEVIIMRRGFTMSGTDLLGVTFTALFALPSIRALLPGAPDFGALSK